MPSGRLYCPDLAAGSVALPPEESHHAVRVLRMREGDEVTLFDGRGVEAVGVIVKADARSLRVRVPEATTRPFELGRRLTLAVALPRLHRQSYIIEKCCELGVWAIEPVWSDRSVTRPDEDAVDKWTRRAIEACKQCGRAWLPEIAAPRSLAASLKAASGYDAVLWATTGSDAEAIVPAVSKLAGSARVLGLVGPEGGWSPEEAAAISATGAAAVSLGPTVLRTETAATTLCAAIMLCEPGPGPARRE